MNVIKIKLENYLSFRNEEVNFNNRDGIYLVIGRNYENVSEENGNGSGKTGFMSAVRFALSGKIRGEFSKDLNNEDVIYKNEKDESAGKCCVEIECEIGDKFYKIVRTVASSGQTLDLYVSLDGLEWTCLSLKAGISRRTGKRESGIVRTQERIQSLFGFDDTLFSNSAYFEQANIDTFARGSLGDKDSIFKSAIGLSKWDDYHFIMKEDLSALLSTEKSISAILEDIGDIDELQLALDNACICKTNFLEEKKKAEASRDQAEAKCRVVSKRAERIRAEYNQMSKNIDDVKETITKLQAAIKANEKLRDDIKSTIVSIKNNISERSAALEMQKKIGLDIKLELSKIVVTKNNKDELEAYLNKYKENEVKCRGLIENYKCQIDSINNGTCPLGLGCEKLTDEARQNSAETIQGKMEAVKVKLNSILTKTEYVEDMCEAIINKNALEAQLENVKDKYKMIRDTLAVQKERLVEATRRGKEVIDTIHQQRVELEKYENTSNQDALNSLSETLKKLESEEREWGELVTQYHDKVDRTLNDIATASSTINTIKGTIAKYERIKKEFTEIQDKKRLIKSAMFVVGKDIPHILISQAIPEIQQYVRDFVYDLSDGRLDMEFRMVKELKTKVAGETQETNAFDPWLCIDGRWLKYQQTSGGERARVDVAIHLGWICFMASRANTRIGTLFLDEVGAALDKDGIEKLVELLKQIYNQYGFSKIFFITQNPDAKKLIDNVIQITKTTEGSKVVFL